MEKYEKIIRKARKAYKNAITGAEKRILESIFPELKESEKDPCIGCTNDKGCVTCEDGNLKEIKIKPKFKVGDTIRCKYDERKFTIKTVDLEGGFYTYTQEGCGNDIDYADDIFELVEPNPADNVEPKFKVGDWVYVCDKTLSQIEKVTDLPGNHFQYWTTDGTWFGDGTNARLWTIQDAKDGDVLVFDDIIMIFKNIKTACTANTYILYCNGDGIVVDDWCDFGPDAHPATKEQRDILFSKMKDAGYEWDSLKKELKKMKK